MSYIVINKIPRVVFTRTTVYKIEPLSEGSEIKQIYASEQEYNNNLNILIYNLYSNKSLCN